MCSKLHYQKSFELKHISYKIDMLGVGYQSLNFGEERKRAWSHASDETKYAETEPLVSGEGTP